MKLDAFFFKQDALKLNSPRFATRADGTFCIDNALPGNVCVFGEAGEHHADLPCCAGSTCIGGYLTVGSHFALRDERYKAKHRIFQAFGLLIQAFSNGG